MGITLQSGLPNQTQTEVKEKDPSTFLSIMAGLGSGLFKIPEGLFSLGASLIDLGAGTNKAADVEEFFAKINPFDEMAEATTAGKITELIINIGIPGGIAFKMGNQLAKTALLAKKGDRYLDLAGQTGKNINKGIREKLKFNTATKADLTKIQKLKAFDRLAPKADKLKAFVAGAGAGGVAEGIFVGDTEDAGTFGDLLGGPTAMERQIEGDAYDPSIDLANRLKFGIEGTAFTGLFGAAGQAIKKLRNAKDADKVADNKILEFVSKNLRSRKGQTKAAFRVSREAESLMAGDLTAANNVVQNISGNTAALFPFMKRLVLDKTTEQTQKKINDKLGKLLFSSDIEQRAGESAADFAKRQTEYIKSGRHLELNPNITTKPNTTLRRVEYEKGKFRDEIVPVKGSEEIIESVSLGPMNRKLQKEFIADIKKLNKTSKSGMKEVNDKRITELMEDSFDQLSAIRMGWGQLYGIMGKRLDDEGVKQFKELFAKKVTGSLDRSYEILKSANKVDQAMLAYRVPKQYMNEAKDLIRKVYRKATGAKVTYDNIGNEIIGKGGKEISEKDLQRTINEIINKDNIRNLPEDGFNIGRSDVPEFGLPGFFVGKSAADDIFRYDNSRKLSEMTGIELQAMKKLLTKNDSALENIILGTQNLSTFVRGNQLIDDMLKKDLLEKSKGNTGIFRNTRTEAVTDFAPSSGKAILGPEIKRVSVAARTDKGLQIDALRKTMGPRVDAKQTLRPISLSESMGDPALLKSAADKEEFLRLKAFDETQPTVISTRKKTKGQRVDMPIIHPIGDKWALAGNVDGVFRSLEDIAKNPNLATKIYQNFILYPKATSQMAKTILSPFTHGRNFLSAGAFAMANGIIPFADREAVRRAYNALQVPLWGARKNIKAGTNLKKLTGESDKAFELRQKNYLEGNEFYQKLLRLGVVNSQVQLGDLMNLLKDVKFGGVTGNVAQNLDSYGLNRLLKVLKNVKKFSEDAYTAEDDFWKIFSFIGETKRLKKYYDDAGIKGAEKFHTLAQSKKIARLMEDGFSRVEAEKMVPKSRITDELIEEEAASIVRNNIPNYAYVGDFIKGLRKWPIGNFVSFPAEILRTSNNIIERGLDEIFYTTTINGKQVRPLRDVGLKRLSGMAFTTAVVPAGVVAGASALYDVTTEERTALRNWVADWSKNSVLVPIRNSETGKLGYVDFSHANAYDTLTRPIQTILNRVAAGETDRNGMMDDFALGVIESTKELGLPFITESIWTEALSDLYMRGGRTRDGIKVWNKDDTLGNKIKAGLVHLLEAQAPLNWKQMGRLGLSMKPIDSKGRFDDRGREYELGNEALGIIGARVVEVKPEEAISYKIAQYTKSASNARSLFNSVALKGGIVTPKELVDAYINANRALFNAQKVMNYDLHSAKILGANQSKIIPEVVSRLGKKQYGLLRTGIFQPYIPSKSVFIKAQQIATKLGVKNPLSQAIGEMAKIRAQLFQVSLDEDQFPIIENPFDTPIIPDVVGSINEMINPTNLAAQNVGAAYTQQANSTLGNLNAIQNNNLTMVEDQLLTNPLDRAITKKQNINKMQLQRPKNNIMRT
jgi:hypothetical protein